MGPGVGILLQKPLDDKQLSELINYIGEISLEPISVEPISDTMTHEWNFCVRINKLIPRNANEGGGSFSIYIWSGLIAEAFGSYEIDPFELKQLKNILGYYPHGHIQIDASSNDKINHLLLGNLAYHLAELFDGFVDFHGTLDPYLILPKEMQEEIINSFGSGKIVVWSKIKPYFEEMIKDFEGNIYDINGEEGHKESHPSHICDARFMKSWLEHPLFTMIK